MMSADVSYEQVLAMRSQGKYGTRGNKPRRGFCQSVTVRVSRLNDSRPRLSRYQIIYQWQRSVVKNLKRIRGGEDGALAIDKTHNSAIRRNEVRRALERLASQPEVGKSIRGLEKVCVPRLGGARDRYKRARQW